jgi:hypothetical protein
MPWPPTDEDEQARLKEHKENRLLYDECHEKIFPVYAKYLADKKFDDKKQKIVLGWVIISLRKLFIKIVVIKHEKLGGMW